MYSNFFLFSKHTPPYLIKHIVSYNPPTIKNNQTFILQKNLLKNRFHKTIIIVSHDIDLIHKLCDHIYLISNGKLIKDGTKYVIFTDIELLNKYHIATPKVIEFSKKVLEKKNVKLGYRDEINDLLKDIYRYAK